MAKAERCAIPDVVVVGGGPAGYTCALTVAKLGGKAILIEKAKLGGTCTNWGCIPTKALQASAMLIEEIRNARTLGIEVSEPKLDFKKVMERKDRVVDILSRGVEQLLRQHNVEVIAGEARIIDKNTVEVNGKQLKTKHVVAATGSSPIVLPFLKDAMTSDDVLKLTEVPRSILIVGGGVIGVEFASIFNAFGTKVTIVEMLPRLVPNEDTEIAEMLRKELEKRGIEIKLNTKATAEMAQGYEKTLVCVGRRPNAVDTLGVPKIGDCLGGTMLAHYASYQGKKLAHELMKKKTKIDMDVVPSCIFTIPEIASVGKPEYEGALVGRVQFAANGKARVSNQQFGMVKSVVDKNTKKIEGIHIIGMHATELISEATQLIGMKADDALSRIRAHPTLSEAIAESIEQVM